VGLNLSWVGVQGGQKAAVLEQLGLEEIGEASGETAADYACAETPGGWLILAAKIGKFDLATTLTRLSSERLCVGCFFTEVAMGSEARASQNGEMLWSVTHDPDKGLTNLDVQGSPPPELAEIRARLEAEQVSAEDVDYMFEAPMELAASVCGYRTGETEGLVWTLLRRGHGATAPKSLSAAMRAELLPLLQSLGWTLATDRPSLSKPEEIFRRLAGHEQTLCFHYASGPTTHITVWIWDTEPAAPGGRHMIRARVQDLPDRRPLWARLGERLRPSVPAGDPIDAVIEKAREHISIADSFLKTLEPSEQVRVEFSGIVAERSPQA
jgi:hypothetical protein